VVDCAKCRPLVDTYGSKIIATCVAYGDDVPADNYFAIMKRQQLIVNTALDTCHQRGIDFLLHSDRDELMYVRHDPLNPALPRAKALREFLASVPTRYDYIHMDNYEALYPRSNENDGSACLLTNRFGRPRGRGLPQLRERKIHRPGEWQRLAWERAYSSTRAAFDVVSFHPVNPVISILHYDSAHSSTGSTSSAR